MKIIKTLILNIITTVASKRTDKTAGIRDNVDGEGYGECPCGKIGMICHFKKNPGDPKGIIFMEIISRKSPDSRVR